MGNSNFAIIGVAAVVLVAVIATVAVTVSNSHGSKGDGTAELSTSKKDIQSFCRPTDYQQTCESSLSSVAGDETDPAKLINIAFNLTVDYVHQAFEHSSVLSAAAKDPRTSDALEDCRELLDYAIDELRGAVMKLSDFSIEQISRFVEDLRVWISSTITYQSTCLDGFDGADTEAGVSMRKALNTSIELTSNILAIVTNIGDSLSHFNLSTGRRLLGEEGELPSWLNSGRRRLLQLSPSEIKPNVTVAKDGSGDVLTISEALLRVPKYNNYTFVIYIKEGVYNEFVHVNKTQTNVMMIGDGPTKTKITGSQNYVDGVSTFRTCTVAVVGNGFNGKDLWIENSAGPAKHQAVAIRVQSDFSVFYNMRFDGYQDTLYAHANRQFYRDCIITGTIDFIFGDSPSIFQNCLILARKPLDNQQNIVTAQGREDRRHASAIILHNCTISADESFTPESRAKIPTYLGRPWKPYSRTFVIQSQLDDLINPKGWLPWLGDYGLATCFYTEFDNRGPGADKSQRVTWKGVKTIDYGHAQKFTVERFLQGNLWLPKTGVPYIPGLLPLTEPDRVN